MISRSDWTSWMKVDQNWVYLQVSWTARVGKIDWMVLWSSKSQEQRRRHPTTCLRTSSPRSSVRWRSFPSEPVQPVDGGFVEVTGPEFDFIKNGRAGSSETAVLVTVLIPSLSCRPYIVQDGDFSCRGKFFQVIAI